MGWRGKIMGALFGGLPGAIIGDVVEEGKKARKNRASELSHRGVRADEAERSLTKEEWKKKHREERQQKREQEKPPEARANES